MGPREPVVELAGGAPEDDPLRPPAGDLEDVYFASTRSPTGAGAGAGMSAWSAVYGIVARDLTRTTRQTSRLLGGVARPFMWLLLVGTGYNAIARLEGGLTYQALRLPRRAS